MFDCDIVGAQVKADPLGPPVSSWAKPRKKKAPAGQHKASPKPPKAKRARHAAPSHPTSPAGAPGAAAQGAAEFYGNAAAEALAALSVAACGLVRMRPEPALA